MALRGRLVTADERLWRALRATAYGAHVELLARAPGGARDVAMPPRRWYDRDDGTA